MASKKSVRLLTEDKETQFEQVQIKEEPPDDDDEEEEEEEIDVGSLTVKVDSKEESQSDEDHLQMRLLLRPWLEAQIESGDIPGLDWLNSEKTLFRIPWKHGAKTTFTPTDGLIFKKWSIHTGRFHDGEDPNYAMLKTRLRMAINKAPDIEEVKELRNKDGDGQCKVFRFLPNPKCGQSPFTTKTAVYMHSPPSYNKKKKHLSTNSGFKRFKPPAVPSKPVSAMSGIDTLIAAAGVTASQMGTEGMDFEGPASSPQDRTSPNIDQVVQKTQTASQQSDVQQQQVPLVQNVPNVQQVAGGVQHPLAMKSAATDPASLLLQAAQYSSQSVATSVNTQAGQVMHLPSCQAGNQQTRFQLPSGEIAIRIQADVSQGHTTPATTTEAHLYVVNHTATTLQQSIATTTTSSIGSSQMYVKTPALLPVGAQGTTFTVPYQKSSNVATTYSSSSSKDSQVSTSYSATSTPAITATYKATAPGNRVQSSAGQSGRPVVVSPASIQPQVDSTQTGVYQVNKATGEPYVYATRRSSSQSALQKAILRKQRANEPVDYSGAKQGKSVDGKLSSDGGVTHASKTGRHTEAKGTSVATSSSKSAGTRESSFTTSTQRNGMVSASSGKSKSKTSDNCGFTEICDMSTQTEMTGQGLDAILLEHAQLKLRFADKDKLRRELFLEHVLSCDENIKRYTGLPTRKILDGVFDILDTPDVRARYWNDTLLNPTESQVKNAECQTPVAPSTVEQQPISTAEQSGLSNQDEGVSPSTVPSGDKEVITQRGKRKRKVPQKHVPPPKMVKKDSNTEASNTPSDAMEQCPNGLGHEATRKSAEVNWPKLSSYDQFLLAIIRFRLGLVAFMIGDLFGIPNQQSSRIFSTWVVYMYKVMGPLLKWPSRQQIQRFLPSAFRENNPQTRAIVGCTGLVFEASQKRKKKKKKRNGGRYLDKVNYTPDTKLKALLATTPSGAFTFVSQLWGDKVSNTHMVQHSGLLNLIEPEDHIVTSHDFPVEELLEGKMATMSRPYLCRTAYTLRRRKKQKLLSYKDIRKSKRVSELQVVRKKALQRLKSYRMLRNVIPIKLKDISHEMLVLGAVLSNFSPPIVK